MAAALKFGISGLRGIAGESLTDDVVQKHVDAFIGVLEPKKVILGRDTRGSGPHIREVVIERLREHGCEIIDIGIVATPTVQFMTRHMGADGSIAVTASHNPPEYNGLKFFDSQGLYLNEMQVSEMKDRMEQGTLPEGGKKEDSLLTQLDVANEAHVERVMNHIDFKVIQNSGLKVVIDPVGGAGTMADPILMRELGIDATIIHGEPSAEFPRGTEPLPENLKILGEAVKKHGADVGFAQDPDADRLALVDENGNAIGEEYTLAFCTDYMLSKQDNPKGMEIATNLSTSRMMDDVANKHGANLIRTKIGEMHVANAIMETDALIGGEGNGGVIWPVVGFGRDSFAGMSIILEYMATSGKKISELVATLPKYEIVRTKVEIASLNEVPAILDRVKEVYKDQEMDTTEGVKVIFDNGWLHARASNTEPIVRFFAEGPTREQAQAWIDKVL